jgi:hypothetical protein
MPKHKRATFWERGTKEPQYWAPVENRLRVSEVNEILAWIEYCFVKSLGPDAFENSIVHHLDPKGVKFTFKQIDAKVQELWKSVDRIRNESPTDHRVIYRIGLKAFEGQNAFIKDERLQCIKARVQQLLEQDAPIRGQKASRRVRNTSKASPLQTSENVARRLFKETKRSTVSPAKRKRRGRPPKNAITVQVEFPSTKTLCNTDFGALRSLL